MVLPYQLFFGDLNSGNLIVVIYILLLVHVADYLTIRHAYEHS